MHIVLYIQLSFTERDVGAKEGIPSLGSISGAVNAHNPNHERIAVTLIIDAKLNNSIIDSCLITVQTYWFSICVPSHWLLRYPIKREYPNQTGIISPPSLPSPSPESSHPAKFEILSCTLSLHIFQFGRPPLLKC